MRTPRLDISHLILVDLGLWLAKSVAPGVGVRETELSNEGRSVAIFPSVTMHHERLRSVLGCPTLFHVLRPHPRLRGLTRVVKPF